MSLILNLGLDMITMCLHTQNEVPNSSGLKVIIETDRDIDRHTETVQLKLLPLCMQIYKSHLRLIVVVLAIFP